MCYTLTNCCGECNFLKADYHYSTIFWLVGVEPLCVILILGLAGWLPRPTILGVDDFVLYLVWLAGFVRYTYKKRIYGIGTKIIFCNKAVQYLRRIVFFDLTQGIKALVEPYILA